MTEKLPNCVPQEQYQDWPERMMARERTDEEYGRLEKEGKPNLGEAEDH